MCARVYAHVYKVFSSYIKLLCINIYFFINRKLQVQVICPPESTDKLVSYFTGVQLLSIIHGSIHIIIDLL